MLIISDTLNKSNSLETYKPMEQVHIKKTNILTEEHNKQCAIYSYILQTIIIKNTTMASFRGKLNNMHK